LTPPHCKLPSGADIGEKALCIHFKFDNEYSDAQFKERLKQKPWLREREQVGEPE